MQFFELYFRAAPNPLSPSVRYACISYIYLVERFRLIHTDTVLNVTKNVIITKRVNEISDLEITHMRHQVRQQCIRTDVERHAQKRIGRPLIKLAVKNRTCVRSPTVRDAVPWLLNLELKQRMARRQVDVIAFARIPATDNQST